MNALNLAALFGAGFGAGFIDSIAGGGGLISIPALLWVGLPPQVALGTNKFQSSAGTFIAVRHYVRSGLLRGSDLWLVIGVTFGAAVLGTLTVVRVSNEVLQKIVPWLLLAVAVYALLSPRFGQTGSRARLGVPAFAWICGGALGFYDGFFGPGTGSFWTLAWMGLAGADLLRATASTKAVNLASNLAALCVFLSSGLIRPDIGLVMIAGQLLGARLGAGLAVRHGVPLIRVVFLLGVFAMILKLLWDQFR